MTASSIQDLLDRALVVLGPRHIPYDAIAAEATSTGDAIAKLRQAYTDAAQPPDFHGLERQIRRSLNGDVDLGQLQQDAYGPLARLLAVWGLLAAVLGRRDETAERIRMALRSAADDDSRARVHWFATIAWSTWLRRTDDTNPAQSYRNARKHLRMASTLSQAAEMSSAVGAATVAVLGEAVQNLGLPVRQRIRAAAELIARLEKEQPNDSMSLERARSEMSKLSALPKLVRWFG